MTDRISPQAAAAREAARHATGEFGVQAHTPPDETPQSTGLPVLDDMLPRLHAAGGSIDWDARSGKFRLQDATGRTAWIDVPPTAGSEPGDDRHLDFALTLVQAGGQTYGDWTLYGGEGAERYLEERRVSHQFRRVFGDERAETIADQEWVGELDDPDVSADPGDEMWAGVHPAVNPPRPRDWEDHRNWAGIDPSGAEPAPDDPDAMRLLRTSSTGPGVEALDRELEVRTRLLAGRGPASGSSRHLVVVSRRGSNEPPAQLTIRNSGSDDAPSRQLVLQQIANVLEQHRGTSSYQDFADSFGSGYEYADGLEWHARRHLNAEISRVLGDAHA